MNQGIETIVYPVKDIQRAKQMFSRLLDAEPYADMPYYVGYRVGCLEIGLDPNGFSQGMTGPINYYTISDIKKSLQALLDRGAEKLQDIKDVGGGKLIATVKSPDGNVMGLIRNHRRAPSIQKYAPASLSIRAGFFYPSRVKRMMDPDLYTRSWILLSQRAGTK